MVTIGFPELPALDLKPRSRLYLGANLLNNNRRCWSVGVDSLGVIGPPRYGKTSGVLIPSLMTWAGPVVCFSSSSTAMRYTGDQRRRIAAARGGDVYVYDLLGSAPDVANVRWSPLAGCENAAFAYRMTQAMVGTVAADMGNSAYFRGGAAKILRAFLHAAALAGLGIGHVHRWLTILDPTEAIQILRSRSDANASWADDLEGLDRLPKRDVRRFYQVAGSTTAILSHPSAPSAANGNDLDFERFVSTSSTLYMLAPDFGAILAPFFQALVDTLTLVVPRVGARMGGQLDPPLLLVYDDVGYLPEVRRLPGLMPDLGYLGIVTLWATHSLSCLRMQFGAEDARALLTSTAAKMVYGGISNKDDLEEFSGWAGRIRDTQIAYYSAGASPPPMHAVQAGLSSTGISRASDGGVDMPILPPEALQHLPPFHAWLFYRSDTPLLVETRPAGFVPEYERLAGFTPSSRSKPPLRLD